MSEDFLSSAANEAIDDLLPEELDWRRLVVTYPLPTLGVAAVAGFLVGRHHGVELTQALRAFVVDEVTANVHSLLGASGRDDGTD